MRNKRKSDQKSLFPTTIGELQQTISNKFENNPDLKISTYEHGKKKACVFYIDYQTNTDKLEEFLLSPLLQMNEEWTNETIKNVIPLSQGSKKNTLKEILEDLLIGTVFIYVEEESEIISYLLEKKEKRPLEKAETESLVLGPKIGFTESLATNMNIVRWRIKSTDLVLEEIKIGRMNPRDVRLVYLKSIANETDVNTMRQRLLDIDVDEIEDGVILKQYLEDNQSALFPQFDLTELPDRFTYGVTKGKVGVLVENSPTGFLGPVNLFTFFESTEDLYMRWNTGTFLRLIRFLAIFVSIIITPLYVALVTYQYGVIPMHLLISIGQSRAAVPFPPVIEALLLEFLIEFLREAGARLPTKVGQTMGVVGGIVIGQAAVQAGLTSNILIIAVAISALASFTSPSYFFTSTIRMIRFPLILLAAAYGMFGIMFGLCFLIIHLLRTTSLGRPFLAPLYPLEIKDLNKVFFRTPMKYNSRRAISYRPKTLFRFSKIDASIKRDNDI